MGNTIGKTSRYQMCKFGSQGTIFLSIQKEFKSYSKLFGNVIFQLPELDKHNSETLTVRIITIY